MTAPDPTTIRQWLSDVLPADWGTAEIVADTDELLVVLDVPEGDTATPLLATSSAGRSGPWDAVASFREATREQRMAIARRAEAAFGRKVSWAARSGDITVAFTTATVPVMTRLRLAERRVLDTLIDAGVARSRSEALAWCVRLVGDNEREWIEQLRQAFANVEAARQAGPKSRRA